jgi:hypothetical protein
LGDSEWTQSSLPFWQSQPEEACMIFGVVNNNCEAIIIVAVAPIEQFAVLNANQLTAEPQLG